MNSEVRIVAPAGVAHTNGVLEVRLEVAGHVPDRLELLRDGEVLAVLEPPYVYAWDTTVEAEGEHTLRTRTVFGETVFEGESREVVVDRTPPRLVTRSPEPGAQRVWVKAPIQAEFSEPMRADTVTSATVRLTVGDAEVPRTVGLSGDGKTLTVSPGEGYAPSNPVRLVLTESVVDLAGNSLVPESRGWDWVVPFWIDWGTGDGARTYLSSSETMESYAFDTVGNLIAVWHDIKPSLSHLRVRRFTNGEWIDHGPSGVAVSSIAGISKASLILNPEGHPIVAWTQEHNRNPYSARIHASQWTGTQWSAMGITSIEEDDAKIYKTAPYLTWTASGRPAITWAERDASGNSTICAAEWSADSWDIQGTCFNIQEQTKDAYPPVLKYTSNNTPTMAWIAKNPLNIYAIHASQFINNVWEPLFQEDLEIRNQDPYVSLAIGPSDTPILSWLYTAGDGHEAVTTSKWHDFTWTPLGPTIMPLSGDLTMMTPALQTDASGTPFITWTGNNSPKHRLHTARWTGQQWESLDDSSFANDGSALTNFHSLQRMSTGEIILSWQESTGTGTRMRVRRFNR
ncbi:Ig-like domain-containing protein [Myxococcus sp. K38C18041901]|uniref:Ig-like domain-containing protein n=1 Tax=Myxococcus guangdongensis TaxID=2906760 RepID=UPI0020A81A8E|nr:Ig-like domain-containing protein [Myxococcus guangdongensis]MCP3062752.1 Ig-like domain-containing protein [Myxococcus guangdongensis]